MAVILGPGYGAHDALTLRLHGPVAAPVLVHIPGLHGDWTLVAGFRRALNDRVRFVEVTYPLTRTWPLAEFGSQLAVALAAAGVSRGWVIGESFGSQVAWALAGRTQPDFTAMGLILAGGFVRHPLPWGVGLMRWVSAAVPTAWARLACGTYGRYARFRHRRDPEVAELIGEFIRRRVQPEDRAAIEHRYGLIRDEDVRPIARVCRLPVHYLAGAMDPLVPFPFVRHWLRRHCPGYRGGVTLWADHNVLGTAPNRSAEIVLKWMKGEPSVAGDAD